MEVYMMALINLDFARQHIDIAPLTANQLCAIFIWLLVFSPIILDLLIGFYRFVTKRR